MYSLFIDTHNENITIILFKDGKILKKSIKESMMQHSVYTMPMIEEILKDNNLTPESISQLIVVNGPGSFTGVRIGVTIAKTYAYLLNIDIKQIDVLKLKAIMLDGNEKLVIESEKNGKYIGLFDKDNNAIEEYKYLKNSDFEEYIVTKKVVEPTIDYEKLYAYLEKEESVNPHGVNPIYVKMIEALK